MVIYIYLYISIYMVVFQIPPEAATKLPQQLTDVRLIGKRKPIPTNAIELPYGWDWERVIGPACKARTSLKRMVRCRIPIRTRTGNERTVLKKLKQKNRPPELEKKKKKKKILTKLMNL